MLKIEVFKNFKFLGLIENYLYIKIERMYRNIGNFEMKLNNFDYSDLLEIENLILFNDEPYFIKTIEYFKNINGITELQLKGCNLACILEDRILLEPLKINLNINYEDIIYNIINSNIINPNDINRKINIIKNANKKNINKKPQEEFTLKKISVREAITRLCGYSNLGYRFNYKNDFLEFEIYEGKNLVDNIVFSSQFNNVDNIELKKDVKNQKNTSYLFLEDVIYKTINYKKINSGIERKEKIAEEGEEITKEELNLKNSNDILKVNINITDTEQFKYKIEYNLGDKVLFEDTFFNFKLENVILEVIEYYTDKLEIEINLGEKVALWN
jgi:hypothetical protein